LNPQRLVAYKYTIPVLWRFGPRSAVLPHLFDHPCHELPTLLPESNDAHWCTHMSSFLALPLHCLFGTSNGFSFLEVGGGGLIHCGNYG
jgi:hypothetical protein